MVVAARPSELAPYCTNRRPKIQGPTLQRQLSQFRPKPGLCSSRGLLGVVGELQKAALPQRRASPKLCVDFLGCGLAGQGKSNVGGHVSRVLRGNCCPLFRSGLLLEALDAFFPCGRTRRVAQHNVWQGAALLFTPRSRREGSCFSSKHDRTNTGL